MASRRMLNHSVVLYNYVGEINDEASYQATIIDYCFCPSISGSSQGVNSNDSATLYVFDAKSIAKSPAGEVRSYLPYDVWLSLSTAEKAKYWTLSDRFTDYFHKGSEVIDVRQPVSSKFRIARFQRFDSGTKRMWHWEVFGE